LSGKGKNKQQMLDTKQAKCIHCFARDPKIHWVENLLLLLPSLLLPLLSLLLSLLELGCEESPVWVLWAELLDAVGPSKDRTMYWLKHFLVQSV